MVKVQKVSMMPLAKIFCAFHAVVGLILGIIVTIGSMTNQQDEGIWSLGPWSLLIFPIVNAGLGFLTGMFLASAYNLFSQWFGGIELELKDNDNTAKLIADIEESVKV